MPNLYVVEGGVNRWLERYAGAGVRRDAGPGRRRAEDGLAFRFAYATGESPPAAWPELAASRGFQLPCAPAASGGEGDAEGHGAVAWPAYAFTKRVKLQTKAAVKGGCG